MRKFTLCIVLLLPFVYIYSQDLDYYYVEFKEGHVPQNIQTTVNSDQTLTISMDNNNLAAVFNAKPIYTFEKAFPSSQRPFLQRVYLSSVPKNTNLNTVVQRVEIENLTLIEYEVVLLGSQDSDFNILPNDYNDILTGGRNTALDLIRAPLAWTVTTGHPDVLVGVADTNFNLGHEDLTGKIVHNIIINQNNEPHGIAVAGQIAAATNNNKGIASIGVNTKLVVSTSYGGTLSVQHLMNGLLELSRYPNVRVINCSWITAQNPYLDEVMEEVNENGVLVVAGAGNGGTSIRYPASYDEAISVTSVGHRVAPTYFHDIKICDTCVPGYFRSWKDVHLTRPDTGENNSHTHNEKVDVTSPGHLNVSLTDKYDEFPAGYRLTVATSIATPIVTGVAALVFAANPNLTAPQVKDIIKNTADNIYHIPWNEPFVGQLGTGRVNAYRAVLTAKCMDDPNYIGNLDLMVRNSLVDYGQQPDNNTQELWASHDIWVRPNSGESYIDVHENPEYDPIQPNYVYVRVTNRSCITSTGNEELELYWAKSHAAPSIWPDLWDGTIQINNVPLGGHIATVTIPSLTPGKEAILEIPWLVPNPEDFEGMSTQPWHFCLVAKIASDSHTPPVPISSNLWTNVKNNNNFAAKNINIVDIIPNSIVGSAVAISNPFNTSRNYRLELYVDPNEFPNEFGKALYEEAEIGIEMDSVLFSAWERGNKMGANFASLKNTKKILATNNNVIIDNIQFEPNEWGTAYVSFNFLTKENSNKRHYTYHVAQRDLASNEIVGGVTYEIRKQPRPGFLANAGNDEEIDRSHSVTLQAADINEDAVYNWYDMDGNLIYTGTSLTVSPQFTQQYKLEVISNLDGLKDYDELQVTVNPYKIESLVPNPATSTVTVNYIAEEASSAYLMFVNQTTGSSHNYILDTTLQEITIDVSIYSTGLYSVILVANGEVQNSKNLIKN